MSIGIMLVGLGAGLGYRTATQHVDPDLAPVLAQYLAWAPNEGRLKDLKSLKFGKLPRGTAATCEIKTVRVCGRALYTELRVVVQPLELTPTNTATVMHELAHCLHDMFHVTDPKALMAADVFQDDGYWTENLEKRVKEAFSD